MQWQTDFTISVNLDLNTTFFWLYYLSKFFGFIFTKSSTLTVLLKYRVYDIHVHKFTDIIPTSKLLFNFFILGWTINLFICSTTIPKNWCSMKYDRNPVYIQTYLMDHWWFMPDWAANCWIICCCSGVYVEGVWVKGAGGEDSGTGLDDGVGAGCLKAFYKEIS